MKRVLVGFDGSEGAENALNKAMMIIDDDGELIIIAIIPLPSDRNLLDQKTYEIIKSRAQNLINSVIHDIGSHGFTITRDGKRRGRYRCGDHRCGKRAALRLDCSGE